jgi:hypothetical protein
MSVATSGIFVFALTPHVAALMRATCSPQFRGSSDEPSPFVNIEFHQALVAHFQQQGLAGLLVHDIGAFHDLVDFERLLAERVQDILSIVQHDDSLQTKKTLILTLERAD